MGVVMNNDFKENIDLNYSYILLKHIDRLSDVSSSLFGNLAKADYSSADFSSEKNNTLVHTSYMFRALIPDSLKDKKYVEDMKQMIKDAEVKRKEAFDSDRKTEYVDNYFNYQKIHVIINLLDRKGLLFDKGGIAKFKNKEELEEVWE